MLIIVAVSNGKLIAHKNTTDVILSILAKNINQESFAQIYEWFDIAYNGDILKINDTIALVKLEH